MALEIFKLVGSVFVDTDKADKSLQKTDKKASGFGKTLASGVKTAGKFAVGVVSMGAAAAGALGAVAESTREYRTEQGKLQAAFETNGFAAAEATKTYGALNGVLGDSAQAVEASNHLAQLCTNAGELAEWTNICTGVFATFGDSLPIEGLTEAANETAKVGQVTGPLADALNWAGVSEDKFNESLAACTSEQERQALITKTLNGLYSDAANKYREVNADVIAANEAQEKLTSSLAAIGGAVEPVMTALKSLGGSLLADLVPGVQQAGEAVKGLLAGDADAADDLGASLSNILMTALDKIVSLVPQAGKIAVSLISTFATTLLKNLPKITSVALNLVNQLVGLLSSLVPELLPLVLQAVFDILDQILACWPQILDTVVSLIVGICDALPRLIGMIGQRLPDLVSTLIYDVLPALISAVTGLVSMLCEQLPVLVPLLLETVISLVMFLLDQIPVLIPMILDAAITLFTMLVSMIPVLLPQIIEMAVSLVTLLCEQIPLLVPLLIQACITAVMAIVDALPVILSALFSALPPILMALWDVIVMLFQNLPAWFGQLFQGVVDIIVGVFSAIGPFFVSAWEWIKDIFSPVGQWFKDIFSKAWEGIKNAWGAVGGFFSKIWQGIKDAFGSVTGWFKNTFSKAWQAVKDVFSTGGKIFDGIKEGIADVFTTTVNAIIRGINKVISVPFNALNDVLKKLKSVSVAGVTPFSWVTTFSVPQIPELEEGAVLEKGQVGLLEGNGAEAVVPLHQNQKWIREVAQDMDGALGGAAGGQIMAVLLDILEAIEALTGMGVYLDTDALVGGIARPMDRKLGQLQAQKVRA